MKNHNYDYERIRKNYDNHALQRTLGGPYTRGCPETPTGLAQRPERFWYWDHKPQIAKNPSVLLAKNHKQMKCITYSRL